MSDAEAAYGIASIIMAGGTIRRFRDGRREWILTAPNGAEYRVKGKLVNYMVKKGLLKKEEVQ